MGKNDVALTPESKYLFGQKGTKEQKLDKEKAEAFHATTAHRLFLTKWA